MKRPLLVAVVALCLFSAFASSPAARAAQSSRTKQYAAEHRARMHRHRKLTPAQRHARKVKYNKEHRARQHRHRAHLKHQR
jgi:hypothetical protein